MRLAHSSSRTLSPGSCCTSGATVLPHGVNFTVFSRHAEEVYLLLFDEPEGDPTDIIRIEHRTRFIWHVFVHGIGPGQLYGFKVRGRYSPRDGLRFNEHKLLLDPYAKALSGPVRNDDWLLYGYDVKKGLGDIIPDTRDNTHLLPKSVVVDDAGFDWEGDERPRIDPEEMVIYEAHLKGLTADPSSGVSRPGTYLGAIEKIPYLRQLGINAVEFLPVHQFYSDDFLISKGLANYWGYNTISFFSPEISYGSMAYPAAHVHEFKTMVRELHKAGIEVILDVVYNHTAEGNELGPTLCLKGLDNPTFYHLHGPSTDPLRYYRNWSGCGNSLKVADPFVLTMVMDSLRYWVAVMHVDGFRFDLAASLGRDVRGNFTPAASFFDAVQQDPVLSRVKLIAEPWDVATYEVGSFPANWGEWNGRYRETLRKFMIGHPGQVPELALRLAGSPDIYAPPAKGAFNSINYVACHDGFTLYDAVSYNEKHNDCNMEDNLDGPEDNWSWNCGAEGETDDPEVAALRLRMVRNFLCCLFFSNGIPMLLGGDECLRTQRGNNNTYCQDSDMAWFDWRLVEKNRDMIGFVRKLIAFTRDHAIRQRRKTVVVVAPEEAVAHGDDGRSFASGEWNDPQLKTLCFEIPPEPSHPQRRNRVFVAINADDALTTIELPGEGGAEWRVAVDTSAPEGETFPVRGRVVPAGEIAVLPRAAVVLVAPWNDR